MSASLSSNARHAAEGQPLAQSLRRAALAVARATGPALFDELVSELASGLRVALVYVGVYEGRQLRTRAAVLDGQPLPSFAEPLSAPPHQGMEAVRFHLEPAGAAASLRAGSLFANQGLQSHASCALTDSAGLPLGLLVAMDRAPMRDAEHIEVMLTIFGARFAAELERASADDSLRRAALAVSGAQGEGVLKDLVMSLASILHVDAAFIAVRRDDSASSLHRLAVVVDGQFADEADYELHGTPCETVLGQRFQAYASDLAALFPGDVELHDLCAQGYAGFCLVDRHGASLGVISVVSRRPLVHVDRIEAILQIFAVRAAAEIERLRADEALRLREEQYRVIFEATSDGFVLRDANLRTLDANPAFYRMYGFDPAHIKAGGGYPAHFPRAYVDGRDAQIRRALAGEETHVETMALRADGTSFWIDLRVVPVRYRGQPHVLQVVRDISALREREQALQRSEARLRATVDAAFDGIIGMDEQGRIVEFNAAAERCFGFDRAQVLGRPLAEVIVPERFREAHARGLSRFLASGHGPYVGRLIETVARHRDGTEFPVELAVSVGNAPDGSIFVGHLRDISSRRRAETRRAELESQLRQAQKMEAIGQLTGGIAHDFNNILTSVIGYVMLAGERADALADARLKRQLSQANLAAQRARELIGQMLTFARRGGGTRCERRAVVLGPSLHQSLGLLRSTLPSSIELAIEIDGELPAVAADVVQIEQVLFNLCINARDAMAGAGRLRVRLQPRAVQATCASCRKAVHGAWLELSVADEGCGIAQEVRDSMFDPFYTTKDIGRGSGMGLAMVHGIVHDHDGHILVESEPGRGSLFRVLLPVSQDEPASAGSSAAQTGTRPATRLNGRVLLVEDQPSVSDFMSELLGTWGFEVSLCRDPVHAYQCVIDQPDGFDVVITDQTMPRLTGVELARRLLALKPTLPVLLYTGFDEGLDDAQLRQLGLRAVLRKPLDHELLLAALRAALPHGRAAATATPPQPAPG